MRQRQTRMSVRLSAAGTCVLTCLLVFTGCGDDRVARYPVSGQVLVDGKPAQGAIVIFCPVQGSEEVMRERPFSSTDAEGRFELRTLEPGDGAPAGDYKVMVRWPMAGNADSENRGDDQRGGPAAGNDRLRNRYVNPDRSGITATVTEGTNELPPFELTMR